MCADWVVVDGKRIRRRTPHERQRYHERGGRCPYGCEPGRCAIEEGPTIEAEAAVRRWLRCGGARRWCWPRPGAVSEQDAVELLQLETIDGLIATAQQGGPHGADQRGHPAAQGRGLQAG